MFERPETLTVNDLPFLPDPKTLSREDLQTLLDKLGCLYNEVDAEEPDEESEAYEEWLDALDEIEDFRDEVLDRLEQPDI
jgi:hypothetical protein